MALTEAYARAHFEARNVLDRIGMTPEELVAEIGRLQRVHDEQVDRLKACEHIADGDEGWETLEHECPSTAAVARLRRAVTDWVPLAKALFHTDHDPKVEGQMWSDFQAKAQNLIRLMHEAS